MSNTTTAEPDLAGRETASLVSLLLATLGLLSVVVGFVLFAGSGHTDKLFVWEVASPVTAGLLGAGFLGAVPMMFHASIKRLWEQARIGVLPALVLVSAMLVVTVVHFDELAISGGALIALVISAGWVLAMPGLTLGLVLALLQQSREPALPLARIQPMPRIVTPLIAIQGAAHLGLGIGLLVEPAFWSAFVPWDLSILDARALGVWCLTLGFAFLQALVEDDLQRIRSGLFGLVAIGGLGLVALAVRAGDVDWQGWPPILALALVGGILATGAIGLLIARRGRPDASPAEP